MRAVEYAILTLLVLTIVAFAANWLGDAMVNAFAAQTERIENAGR